MATIAYRIDVKTVSEANVSEHWGSRARRAKAQRHDAWAETMWALARNPKPEPPLVITLTRVAPRRLDQGDNEGMSCKHLRDGIAEALEINDGDPRIEWRYAQRRGKPREYAVEVRIEGRR
jgi:hypothetical protein